MSRRASTAFCRAFGACREPVATRVSTQAPFTRAVSRWPRIQPDTALRIPQIPIRRGRQFCTQANVEISEKRLHSLLESEITHMSLLRPEQLTLEEILSYRCPKKLALKLQKALPVRYAIRIKLIQNLPMLDHEGHLARVIKIYTDSFKRLRLMDFIGDDIGHAESATELRKSTRAEHGHSSVPHRKSQARQGIRPPSHIDGTDIDDPSLQPFVEMLKDLKRRHCNIMTLVVRGLKNAQSVNALSSSEIDVFMNAFFTSRLGTEMITAHFLQLYRDPGSGGAVEVLNMRKEVDEVVQDVSSACERFYGEAPQIEIRLSGQESFPFFQGYWYYIINELLKNAARSTIENAREKNLPLPPISIIITVIEQGDLLLRIRDEGGGVPAELLRKIWSYLFTTAGELSDMHIAGYGCGLPMTRTHVLYCGGDMQLYSLPDFGTDVWVRLPPQA